MKLSKSFTESVSLMYVHLNGTLKIKCEHSFLQWQRMGWIYFCNLSGFTPYSGGSYDDGTSESGDRWRWLLIGHTNYSRHVSSVQCIRIHHHTTVCMIIGVGNLFGKSYESKNDFSIDFLDIGITIQVMIDDAFNNSLPEVQIFAFRSCIWLAT